MLRVRRLGVGERIETALATLESLADGEDPKTDDFAALLCPIIGLLEELSLKHK